MKIVLVDPSRVILKVTAGYLAPAGYEVVSHTNAAVALERIRADPDVEVLVTSLQPHGMPGLELCAAARRLVGARRALHVIVMSSSGGRNVVDALDSGADDFMGKPPAPEEFLARLRVAGRATTLQRELIRLATVDSLTGLPNRRAFFDHARDLERAGGTMTIGLFDIDRFKQVNDIHGHAAGDQVIAAVAAVAGATRNDDAPSSKPHAHGVLAARIGGEEFALLFQDLALPEAVAACERLRMSILALRFPEVADDLLVSCSFGVVERQGGEAVEDALKRADVALYAAKSAGRNRVVSATESGVNEPVGLNGMLRERRVSA